METVIVSPLACMTHMPQPPAMEYHGGGGNLAPTGFRRGDAYGRWMPPSRGYHWTGSSWWHGFDYTEDWLDRDQW